MSTLAMFLALGGGAYAATSLPSGSVGTEQIQPRAVVASRLATGAVDGRQIAPGAVTGPKIAAGAVEGDHIAPRAVTAAKLAAGSVESAQIAPRSVTSAKLANGGVDTTQIAPGAVTLNRLSEGVQRRILQPLAGPAGDRGPAGPAGPGAGRMRYAADAVAGDVAVPRTVVDVPGLTMRARCLTAPQGVQMSLSVTPAEDVTIHETVTVDHGTAITAGGTVDFTGNLAIDVPGGVETVLGGPGAEQGFARVVATLVMPSASRTITATVVIVVDADAGRCTLDGTAVTAA